jgi:hypothetical protein
MTQTLYAHVNKIKIKKKRIKKKKKIYIGPLRTQVSEHLTLSKENRVEGYIIKKVVFGQYLAFLKKKKVS